MNSVSVRTVARRFAAIPEKYIFSDLMTSAGIRVIALILASKSDHSAYGGGMSWPTFKVPELAQKLGMAQRTLERTTSYLQKAGFLKKTKTKQGVRFEVLDKVFEDDVFRGKPRISSKAKTLASMSVITSGISDRAFHLLLMLEATAGARWETVKIPQSKLVTYFPSTKREREHITERRLNDWLRELEGAGLLTRIREGVADQNEYLLHKEEIVINGVDVVNKDVVPVLATPGTKHTDEEELEDFESAPRGTLDFTGMALAREFQKKLKPYRKDKDWAVALKQKDAINLPALARTFDRWMSNGVSHTDIYRMIDLYPLFSNHGRDQEHLPEVTRERLARTPIWRDFLGMREMLHLKATGKEKNEIAFDPEADGFAEYWGLTEDDITEYETPKTWAQVKAEQPVENSGVVNFNSTGEDRLAYYMSRQAS